MHESLEMRLVYVVYSSLKRKKILMTEGDVAEIAVESFCINSDHTSHIKTQCSYLHTSQFNMSIPDDKCTVT